MPIYEYVCGNCDHEFEELRKMSDGDPSNCPQCDKATVTKQLSISAFHLKGGGWYKDGYTKDKANTTGSASTSVPSSDASKSSLPSSFSKSTASGSSPSSNTSSSASSHSAVGHS